MPKQPGGFVVGVLMALVGLALVVNFRGVVDFHAERSVKAARRWSPFGPREQTPQRRAENLLLVKILDRIFGLLFMAGGVALMWQAWQGTLIEAPN